MFLREGYTANFFFQSISWNPVWGAFPKPSNTFMKYFYFSISMALHMFSSIQKLCLQRKDIFWQRKSNGINFDKWYLLLKTKTKKSKRPKCIWIWNHNWKTGKRKKHVLAYFQNFGWLTNSSIIFEWMLHHTTDHTMIFIYWLFFTFYITYIYNNTVYIDYFDASTYTNFYNSLQYTLFILQVTSSLLRN